MCASTSAAGPAASGAGGRLADYLAEKGRDFVARRLAAFAGDRERAARSLGIGPDELARRLAAANQ